ncbi:hypothetical protein D5086_032382 [Populus alba]|uniref:Uncharacterized protein n=1 Tax=Populus alba TaxID=43335 RepID=A0ACC4AL65_POPAL
MSDMSSKLSSPSTSNGGYTESDVVGAKMGCLANAHDLSNMSYLLRFLFFSVSARLLYRSVLLLFVSPSLFQALLADGVDGAVRPKKEMLLLRRSEERAAKGELSVKERRRRCQRKIGGGGCVCGAGESADGDRR